MENKKLTYEEKEVIMNTVKKEVTPDQLIEAIIRSMPDGLIKKVPELILLLPIITKNAVDELFKDELKAAGFYTNDEE